MNILVIGGCHTYGHGLSDNQSFVDQFTQQVEQQYNGPVSVNCHSLIDLHQVLALLPTLPLTEYDLILLQLGHYRLQHPPRFRSLLTRTNYPLAGPGRLLSPLTADDMTRLRQTPVVTVPQPADLSIRKRLKTAVKLSLLYGFSATRRLARLNEVQSNLRTLLTRLHPHRQRTVLLTPFTHLEPISQFMRQRGRQLFLELGRQHGFWVFDTDQVIQPTPAYFLPNDCGHLNPVGHELLGRSLFAFYKARFGTEIGKSQRNSNSLGGRPNRQPVDRLNAA